MGQPLINRGEITRSHWPLVRLISSQAFPPRRLRTRIVNLTEYGHSAQPDFYSFYMQSRTGYNISAVYSVTFAFVASTINGECKRIPQLGSLFYNLAIHKRKWILRRKIRRRQGAESSVKWIPKLVDLNNTSVITWNRNLPLHLLSTESYIYIHYSSLLCWGLKKCKLP